jgi:hypothetical protein
MAASTATPPHFGHGILDAIGVVPEEDPTIIPKPLRLQSSGASKLSSVKRHKARKTQYNGPGGCTTELNPPGGQNMPTLPLVLPCALWPTRPVTQASLADR